MKYNKPNCDNVLYELENEFTEWFKGGKFKTPEMTSSLYPYNNLFSPITINQTQIKNRIVMGPMGNISMADEFGRPSEKMLSYFEARAKGGVGLITTGLVPTSMGIDPTVTELDNLTYFPRIGRSRTNLSGWRDLAYVCHNHGAKVFIQLTPGLGRVGNPECLINQLKLPVSASMNPNFYISAIPCARLTDGKAKKIIKKTGQAAADAKACLIDGVYLHGHEGYLMEQMTNTAFNRRKFGRYSNWMNFGLDMVREIRERCGDKFPIYYRIDLSLALNSTYGNKLKKIKSLKKFKNERTISETLSYMAELVKAGVDMFDVDLGCYDNWWLPHPPATMPSGCYTDIAKIAKDYFEENNIKTNSGHYPVVVAVGKLGFPDLAEQVLRDKKADMIMLARPLLSDPDWANKAYSGKTQSIRPCIGCHEACIKEFVDGGHPQCAVCPTTAFEHKFGEIKKVQNPKKIAVIGAGPAGVVATDTLISRGHSVDLYEKGNEIGGTLIPASVPKFKYELKNYVNYLKNRIEECKKTNRLKVYLNTKATVEDLSNVGYDEIVVATGSNKIGLVVDGAVQKHVKSQNEVLLNPKTFENAKNVLIVGGGDVGCEMAYWLASEHGKNVTIVEISPYLMARSCTANRGHIIHSLEKLGVQVYNCSRVQKINEDSAELLVNYSKSVPSPFNTWTPVLPDNIKNPLAKKIREKYKAVSVDADLVVMHATTVSNNELYHELVASNKFKKVHVIGDASVVGRVFGAVKSAFNVCVGI